MPETQRVTGSATRAGLAMGAVLVAITALVGVRFASQQAVPSASLTPATATTAAHVSSPTATVTASPAPSLSDEPTPSATASPRPAAGIADPEILTPATFARLHGSGRYVGETLVVRGRIVPVPEVPGDQVSDGLNCDGERACVYGQLEDAFIHGGTRPLLIWSQRIATPLAEGERYDGYFWPSEDRAPLPLEGLLVLHIDTTYSVEFLGRAIEDASGSVWPPESVVALDPASLDLDEVAIVDAWLAGENGAPCPDRDSDPPLPVATCGDPSWILRRESPIFAHGDHLIPVQSGAFREFALWPEAGDLEDYEPRRGMWVVGRRLGLDGGCGDPACAGWHVLGEAAAEVYVPPIAEMPIAPAVPDAGWISVATTDHGQSAWSPDGRWLLVTVPGHLLLIDARTGEQRNSWDFDSGEFTRGAVWVDGQTFMAVRHPPIAESIESGLAPAVVGRVVSHRLSETIVPVWRESDNPGVWHVAGGDGAVAFMTTDDSVPGCGSDGCWRYRIWTPGGISPERPGMPVAWSPAGDRLAVLHQRQDRAGANTAQGAGFGGFEGWLEVITWPGLRTVLAERSVIAHDQSVFSPEGRWLATAMWPPSAIELASGRVRRFESEAIFFGQVWDAQGRLIGTDANGDLWLRHTDRHVLDGLWQGAGHSVVGAADGSRQVAWLNDRMRGAPFGLFTVIEAQSPAQIIALPPQAPDAFVLEASVAPDGAAFAIWIGEYSKSEARLMMHPLE